jgi:hypothetical protein
MISICVSLVLGLVSLAGCQVQEPNDVKTAAETMQVLSLHELLYRASVAVSVHGSVLYFSKLFIDPLNCI